ncbi:hypothetical protein METP3_00602 [Methanosarcinales archaeon]|nr:hypothetical protein METP3_00602 [Methanosarcinales archaeon]
MQLQFNRISIMKSYSIFLILIVFSMVNPASARVELTDFFSDFTTSDVTINSDMDFNGKAVFELLYSGELVESHEVPVNARAGEPLTKVIIWQEKPQHDFYTAAVTLYEGDRLVSKNSYHIAYGSATIPSFQVVDFSPSDSGVLLLLRSFNPTVADIKIELLDNNDIVYSKTREDISITTSTDLQILWPFLLIDNKKYVVRAKIYSHRLYAPPLVNTYISGFTATDDVEILPADVQVDEYGASVTILGKSQVPFDGSIVVSAKNRATGETHVYRQQLEDILTSGKDSTAGVVWKGIAPGNYDVIIEAVNHKNITIDKYETVLRIPEYPAASITSPANSTPGFEGIVFLIALVVISISISRKFKV